MSDEKRKSARLQGRFSDESCLPKTRREKPKRYSDSFREERSSRSSLGKEKNSLQAVEGFNVKFDKRASASFQQLEEKVKPVEINKQGEHTLSVTDNGKSRVIFEPDFIPKGEAEELMTIINSMTQWYDKNIIIHGKEFPQPRLVAWFGPFPYAYSGAMLDAAEMPSVIADIKEKAEKYLEKYEIKIKLNSVLLNLYRNEKDSVAWHSDDELELGFYPTIASVSLGACRKFEMKIKSHMANSPNLASTDYVVNLTPGSLIVMDGCMQKDWKHRVPKEYHDRGPRINLTFRTVYPSDKQLLQTVIKSSINSRMPEVPLTPAENSSSLSPSVKDHVFDNNNFPPLGSTNRQNKSNLERFQSSEVVQLKNGSLSADRNYSSDMWDSGEDNDVTGSNVKSGQAVPNLSNNTRLNFIENNYMATDVVVSDSQNEEVSEASTTDDYNKSRKSRNHTGDSGSGGSDASGLEKRYELNANAPDFIPGQSFSRRSTSRFEIDQDTDYSRISLVRLSDIFRTGDVPSSRFEDFYNALMDKIDDNPSFFLERDHYEIECLRELNDGSQSVKNQNVILDRLSSMIRNAGYRNRKNNANYTSYQNRSYQRDENRLRSYQNSYRGSSYRGRNYNKD